MAESWEESPARELAEECDFVIVNEKVRHSILLGERGVLVRARVREREAERN